MILPMGPKLCSKNLLISSEEKKNSWQGEDKCYISCLKGWPELIIHVH